IRPLTPEDQLPEVVGMVRAVHEGEQTIAEVLQGIDRALARGLGITSLVLQYGQIGRDRPGSSAVSLSNVVDAIVRDMKDDLTKNQISIETVVPQSCTFAGNKLHMHWIVKNLVDNARDALLELEDGKPRALAVHITEEPTRIMLSVSDTGIGIPA